MTTETYKHLVKAPYGERCDKKTAKPRFCLHTPRKETGNEGKNDGRFCIDMQSEAPKQHEYTLCIQMQSLQAPADRRLPPAPGLSEAGFGQVGNTLATRCARTRNLPEAQPKGFRTFFPPKRRQIFCQYFATGLTFFQIVLSGFKNREPPLHRAETSHSRATCRAKCHFVRQPKNLPRTFHVPELFTTFVA